MPLRARVHHPWFLVLAGAVALASCRAEPGDEDNLAQAANNIADMMPLPTTAPTLDRAGILDILANAASAFAVNADDNAEQRALAGRRFAIRLPFGCADEQADSKAPLRLIVRPGGRSYEVRAMPSLTAKDAGFELRESENEAVDADAKPKTAVPAVETVQGFWIERPWILAEQCPSPPDEAEAPVEPDLTMTAKPDATDEAEEKPSPIVEHRVGIAQFFTASDSRLGSRSGRDYSKVVTLSEGEKPPSGALLLLEGRLRAWPEGKVAHCRKADDGGRPICVLGVTVDRVAVERADTRTVVAEWTN